MIKECMETFKVLLEKHGNDLIYDNIKLKEGTYILVDEKKENYDIFNIEDENNTISPSIYKELVKMDYLSCLITMDKPVDSKKTIHSNNYMSIFIKKENLSDDIINDRDNNRNIYKALDRYFTAIQKLIPDENSKKKEDKEKLKIYESFPNKILEIDIEELNKNKAWVESNILKIKEDDLYKEDKNYLKIFFKSDYERFENEFYRYIIQKIYNSNDYNIYRDDMLYGLPSNNMQLNSSKPSLKMMTRKNYCPILLNMEDALLQYQFFKYLESFSLNGENVLYVNENGFYTYNQIKEELNAFNGHLLKLKRDTSLNLVDFKIIMGYRPKKLKRDFHFVNILNSAEYEDSDIKYGIKTSLTDMYNLVDNIIYSKALKQNIFNDDIKIKNQFLKSLLNNTKNSMYDWFYQGKEKEGYIALRKIFIDLIEHSITQGYIHKARTQFNLMYSLKLYFENGDETMATTVKETRENLIEKLNTYCNNKEMQFIENDEEYYYATGQVVRYLLSLRNKTLNQSEINPILRSKNNKKLKFEIEKIYRKANHSKYISGRFNALYSMVLHYTPTTSNIDSTNLLAGFLGLSILKNKNEDVEDVNEEN